jgi:DNA-binding NarL/FixJ family response regulator
MAGAQVCIWHEARLYGECLAYALSCKHTCECRWIDPSDGMGPDAAWLNRVCQLLLLDAATPTGQINEIMLQLRRCWPDCKSIFLVSEKLTDRLFGLTQFGSQGCVRENSALDELGTAIRLVLEGRTYFSPELANALFAQLNGCDPQANWGQFVDSTRLTSREREVLRLIAWENLSNKQIARRLHVSLYTVKNHVHNIIEKLHVTDRHGAVKLAQQRNLISASTAI